MKRNWEVIRKIMIQLENLPPRDGQLDSASLEDRGIPNEVAAYHMLLLQEAGLIEGGGRKDLGTPYRFALRLTWNGHELLDQIRRDTVWASVKTRLMNSGLDMSVQAVRAAAAATIKELLG